jgi:hypothetical protein
MKGHDYTLWLFYAKSDIGTKSRKMNENRLGKKNLKFLKTFSWHTTYVCVV